MPLAAPSLEASKRVFPTVLSTLHNAWHIAGTQYVLAKSLDFFPLNLFWDVAKNTGKISPK